MREGWGLEDFVNKIPALPNVREKLYSISFISCTACLLEKYLPCLPVWKRFLALNIASNPTPPLAKKKSDGPPLMRIKELIRNSKLSEIISGFSISCRDNELPNSNSLLLEFMEIVKENFISTHRMV